LAVESFDCVKCRYNSTEFVDVKFRDAHFLWARNCEIMAANIGVGEEDS
jgi:hypothetical protein